MRFQIARSLFLTLIVLSSVLRAQEVVKCPGANLSLSERWKWASRVGSRSIDGKEFWVGYSVKRLMNENSFMNSGNFYSGSMELRRSLYDVVSGDTSRRNAKDRTWGGSERNRWIKVLKDVAILFTVSGGLDDEGSLRKLELSDMELNVDLNNKTLLWLGEAADDQSIGLLKGIFDRQLSTGLKKELVTAIGIHQNSSDVFPFLAGVLKGDQTETIRSQAAFWLGQQNRPESLPVLVGVAENDRSDKVKEQAVFAISQLSSEESIEALINLARKGGESRVRGRAAFWLGQKASQKGVATLESIIVDDEEPDVQRQALFALAQIHSAESVDRLIKIAKTHPNLRIRKQAIQCLGQSEDPKALDALIAIVRN